MRYLLILVAISCSPVFCVADEIDLYKDLVASLKERIKQLESENARLKRELAAGTQSSSPSDAMVRDDFPRSTSVPGVGKLIVTECRISGTDLVCEFILKPTKSQMVYFYLDYQGYNGARAVDNEGRTLSSYKAVFGGNRSNRYYSRAEVITDVETKGTIYFKEASPNIESLQYLQIGVQSKEKAGFSKVGLVFE